MACLLLIDPAMTGKVLIGSIMGDELPDGEMRAVGLVRSEMFLVSAGLGSDIFTRSCMSRTACRGAACSVEIFIIAMFVEAVDAQQQDIQQGSLREAVLSRSRGRTS
jgi:hypothetical protein